MDNGVPAPWPGGINQLLHARDNDSMAVRIVGFANLLRAVGLSTGTESTILALRAVSNLAAGDSVAFFWVLYSLFVTRRSEQDVFTQAFTMYWMYNGPISDLLGTVENAAPHRDRQPMFRRLQDALSKSPNPSPIQQAADAGPEMTGTYSDVEVLRHMDFAQMSEVELQRARREIADLRMPFENIPTRRFRAADHGTRIDIRRTIHDMARSGGDIARLRTNGRTVRRVPLVVLCDISGSMERYARVLVHFLYFLANDRDRVSVFLFATRLSNVTQSLKNRDPDRAIARLSQEVDDWSGGTRIGACLQCFNRDWSRRLLGQNATVLILTDGLERDNDGFLAKEIYRLRLRSRRLIWLNPLTGYAQYEPIASGARILSEHVDAMLPCHNLDSLKSLADGLSARAAVRRQGH